MSIRNKIIELLGGVSYERYEFENKLYVDLTKNYETLLNRFYTLEKKLKDNGISGKVSSPSSLEEVQGVARGGELGNIYSTKDDKKAEIADFTTGYPYFRMGKDKKKI